jgi:hypothetical protein
VAYLSGIVSVLSASATPICRPGPGGCFVQNQGANTVTLGGPGVTAGAGLVLPPAVPATAPAVPATGVAQYSNSGSAVVVTVSGGTVTIIAVNGVSTGLTSGAIYVPAGGTITLTYSAAPTWAWAVVPHVPVFIATGILPLSQDADDQLYGRAAAGASNVAFLAAG